MQHKELAKLQKQFDKLHIEEQMRRMKYLLKYYIGELTDDANWIVDATKYWEQFELLMEEEDAENA